MNREREQEIRRLAHDHAARELGAVLSNWEIPARLFSDPEERDEFEIEVVRIIHRLEAKGRAE
ncbi:hypothetical protein [Streptomyces sp. NPDC001268]|uniref:hypothetical protein n=1 Tax=Streptomyces sp. NPDC001268 TaxID=3364553 RepID=UPI0036BD0808